MAAVEQNLKAYKILFEIEVSLREFLILRCEEAHGSRWWESVLASAAARRLEERRVRSQDANIEARRAKELRNAWGARSSFHPIYFVDLPELGAVFEIRENVGLAAHLASSRPGLVKDLVERVLPARNAVAHHRPITAYELKVLEFSHGQLRQEIGVSLFERLCEEPPSIVDLARETLELREALVACVEAVREMRRADLSRWRKLRNRWWLEPKWQFGAEVVRDAFDQIDRYQQAWDTEFVGRSTRMQRWTAGQWDGALAERALALLRSDFAQPEEH